MKFVSVLRIYLFLFYFAIIIFAQSDDDLIVDDFRGKLHIISMFISFCRLCLQINCIAFASISLNECV